MPADAGSAHNVGADQGVIPIVVAILHASRGPRKFRSTVAEEARPQGGERSWDVRTPDMTDYELASLW